ncbi:hypothetical protein I312_103613 [Cryptococcus bacillisporus CA1280]|uniref:LisH domain-containing protein n=1 Tax=Cryptococcus bacillisporus CA1280 TaxID=1296109 RepID=A0A0D0VPK6_CRYGA|nr:hypothetical protein I312_03414 [Cryptococcus bacillisporus CA1280]
MLPPLPPKPSGGDPLASPPPPEGETVQLSSVEINILVYLYLLESNFTHTAFTLLAESNLPATPLFQHFNPAYPTPSASTAAATAKAARASARQRDRDAEHAAPAFGSAAGRIERGELIRKLWKAVRWEEVERHVAENGEPLSPQCPNPFHLLIPHVCPPSYPSAASNPPLPLPAVLQASSAPPPKRPQAFPPPSPPASSINHSIKKPARSTAQAETRKEKPRKRARMSDAEDDEKDTRADSKPPKKKERERERETLRVPSSQASRATSPDKSRRPSPRSKDKDAVKLQNGIGSAVGGRDEIGVWTEHRDVVSNVAWNPKNVDLLATGSSDGFVRLWDFLPPPPSGTSPATPPSLTLSTRPTGISHKGIESSKKTITSVAWHPDGTILATGSQDGVGRLFTPSGQLQAIMSYGRGAVNAMKWSPSGTQILVGKDDFTVCKWMDRGGSMAMKMCYDAHTKEVNDVDWLDDQVFASAGNDHAIHVHHGDDKRPRFTFRGHADDVTKIKWSPPHSSVKSAERLLASVSDDGYCMIWKLPYYPSARGTSASVGAGAGAGAGARSLSPVKKMEPPSDEDEYLYQQPQQPQPQPQQQQQQPQHSLSDPNSAPDSSTTPSAPPHTVLSIENCLHRLHVVSGSENKRMSMLEWMPVDQRDAGDERNARGHGQGRMILAAGGQDSTIKLFDALSGETLHVLPGLESGTGSLAFSPFSLGSLIDSLPPIPTTTDPSDPAATGAAAATTRTATRLGVGKYGLLAGGGWDGVLRIWDVETGKVLWGMEVEEEEGKRMVRERPMMLSMAWREDGKHLACGLFNKTLMVVNIIKALEAGKK